MREETTTMLQPPSSAATADQGNGVKRFTPDVIFSWRNLAPVFLKKRTH